MARKELKVVMQVRQIWWFKYFKTLIIKCLGILHIIGFSKNKINNIFIGLIDKAFWYRIDKGSWKRLSVSKNY